MFDHPRWQAIESPQEFQRLRADDPGWAERSVCFADTPWNQAYRDFVLELLTVRVPTRFPTREALLAEAEHRTAFVLASNPAHVAPMVLTAIRDHLLA